jgi:predicted RNase H-like nuclease
MTVLVVGFDSAWTVGKQGALVAALVANGSARDLGPPLPCNFEEAARLISSLQLEHGGARALVFLDQPTIVKNTGGQRPVEGLVSSPVGRRRGGVQPANTSRTEMFGAAAPIWSFLSRFGGAADLRGPVTMTTVVETFPVLALVALGWTLPCTRRSGRLPKYNPERRETFSIEDWKFVCCRVADALRARGLSRTAAWVDEASRLSRPRKADQDCIDACICLIAAMYFASGEPSLCVGQNGTGYIVVPHGAQLEHELRARCAKKKYAAERWLRQLPAGPDVT